MDSQTLPTQDVTAALPGPVTWVSFLHPHSLCSPHSVDFVMVLAGMLRMSPDAMNALLSRLSTASLSISVSDQPGLGHLVGQSQEWGLAFPASPTSICEIGMAGGPGRAPQVSAPAGSGAGPGYVQAVAESPYLSGLSVWLQKSESWDI